MKSNFKITTLEDVKQFIIELHETYKLAFHPDDDFADYVNNENGKHTFTKQESERLNGLMEDAFDVCEQQSVDIYEFILANLPTPSLDFSNL